MDRSQCRHMRQQKRCANLSSCRRKHHEISSFVMQSWCNPILQPLLEADRYGHVIGAQWSNGNTTSTCEERTNAGYSRIYGTIPKYRTCLRSISRVAGPMSSNEFSRGGHVHCQGANDNHMEIVWKWLVPLTPLVNIGFADHYPYEKWLAIIGIPNIFRHRSIVGSSSKKGTSQSSHTYRTYRTYPAILVTGGYQGETDPYPAVLHASQDILEEVPWCRCRGWRSRRIFLGRFSVVKYTPFWWFNGHGASAPWAMLKKFPVLEHG